MRADEEAARVQEQAEEERQQAVDAERRLAILRGEDPPSLAPPPSKGRHDSDRDADGAAVGRGERRNKRKRAGENDTDFEMRVARSRIEGPIRDASHDDEEGAGAGAVVKHQSSSAPLVDAAGHIDLFAADPAAAPARPRRAEKNPEAEAEAARKKRELEDQYTMRFANAAGFRTELSKTSAGPWYAAKRPDGDPQAELAAPGKDVWGNEDPRRRDREAARVVASDPLALMKRGAAQVREVARERRAENEERERALRQLRREERRHDKKRRRGDDEDRGADASRSSRSHRGDGHGHRARSRSRSREDEARRQRDDSRRHRPRSHDDGERGHRHHHSPTRKHGEGRSSSRRHHGSKSRYDEGARDGERRRDDRKTSVDRRRRDQAAADHD